MNGMIKPCAVDLSAKRVTLCTIAHFTPRSPLDNERLSIFTVHPGCEFFPPGLERSEGRDHTPQPDACWETARRSE